MKRFLKFLGIVIALAVIAMIVMKVMLDHYAAASGVEAEATFGSGLEAQALDAYISGQMAKHGMNRSETIG